MKSAHAGQVVGVMTQETGRSARGLVEFLGMIEDQALLPPNRH